MKKIIILFSVLLITNIKLFAAIHIVQVANFSFSPQTVNASTGDTIRWIWVSGSHTTTSVTVPSGAESWDHPMNSTSTSFDFVLTAEGTYNYVCTPHSGMMTGTLIVTIATGINEKNNLALFGANVFPNPVKESANIVLNSDKSQKISLKIFNLTGTIIYENNFTSIIGKNYLIWNLKSSSGQNIRTGQYYYIIETESGEKVSGKILVDV